MRTGGRPPFTGVLGFEPWRTSWPRPALSFLRLSPRLITVDGESPSDGPHAPSGVEDASAPGRSMGRHAERGGLSLADATAALEGSNRAANEDAADGRSDEHPRVRDILREGETGEPTAERATPPASERPSMTGHPPSLRRGTRSNEETAGRVPRSSTQRPSGTDATSDPPRPPVTSDRSSVDRADGTAVGAEDRPSERGDALGTRTPPPPPMHSRRGDREPPFEGPPIESPPADRDGSREAPGSGDSNRRDQAGGTEHPAPGRSPDRVGSASPEFVYRRNGDPPSGTNDRPSGSATAAHSGDDAGRSLAGDKPAADRSDRARDDTDRSAADLDARTLAERVDVTRLADRLSGVLERNARIERERRGR